MTLADKPEPTALSAPEDPPAPLPMASAETPPASRDIPQVEVLAPSRALVPQEIGAPRVSAGERLVRMAYAAGIRGRLITSPLSKPAKRRVLATVTPPLPGDRAAGIALRAGHFLVHGVKLPIAQLDFKNGTRMAPPLERAVHSYLWLRDLAGSGARPQVEATALRIHRMWLDAHPLPAKGPAWEVEVSARRTLAWLVHAPLILSNKAVRGRTLAALDKTARWLDSQVSKACDKQAEVFVWGSLVAAGLLLPEGKPRRLFAEAGMARALGETAPLLLIGMRAFVATPPDGFTSPATVLPVQIFLWSDEIDRGFIERTSAAIIVLLLFLLVMNALAIYLRNKFEKTW